MKMVVAYVQAFMADAVVDALHEIPEVTGATLTKVQGFGRGRAKGSTKATEGDFVGTRVKARVEVVVADGLADRVVAAITDAARTGNPGDGKICVLPVESAVRIRTAERDEKAV